jgi:hypothetical protein
LKFHRTTIHHSGREEKQGIYRGAAGCTGIVADMRSSEARLQVVQPVRGELQDMLQMGAAPIRGIGGKQSVSRRRVGQCPATRSSRIIFPIRIASASNAKRCPQSMHLMYDSGSPRAFVSVIGIP